MSNACRTLWVQYETTDLLGRHQFDYEPASPADVLRWQGWEDCPTCEGTGRYAWGESRVPLELGPNECADCAFGLVPSEEMIDAAFDAFWKHLPNSVPIRVSIVVPGIRAALVEAARKENE